MAKKQAAAVPVADLVRMALLNVANVADGVKLSGKGGLFASAAGANGEAIAECLHAAAPLLTVLRKEGKAEIVGLAPAGFERIARELPEEKVGPLAWAVAAAVPVGARIEFLQAVMSRTPLAAAELTPLLEEAVAAEKAEQDARAETAKRRRAAEEASRAALTRALELFEERRQNRLNALRREYEIEGGKAAELPEPPTGSNPPRLVEAEPTAVGAGGTADGAPRQYAERTVSAWLYNTRHKKMEAAIALERLLRSLEGVVPIGATGDVTEFDGHVHECERGVSDGEVVQVVRPGWRFESDPGEPLLRALVE